MGPQTPNFGKEVSQIRYTDINDSFACPCYPLVNSNNTGTSHNVVFVLAGNIFSISVAICCGNVEVPNFEVTIDNPSSLQGIFVVERETRLVTVLLKYYTYISYIQI